MKEIVVPEDIRMWVVVPSNSTYLTRDKSDTKKLPVLDVGFDRIFGDDGTISIKRPVAVEVLQEVEVCHLGS
jgi:hypothetical protein